MQKNKLNYFSLKKALAACSMILFSISGAFAFSVKNTNSLGGQDDYVYVVLGRIDHPGDSNDPAEREKRQELCQRTDTKPPTDELLASDLPYGVKFKATQQEADYDGNKKSRICMYVQFRMYSFKAVFDDDDACELDFVFREKNVGYYGDIYDMSDSGNCNLSYQNKSGVMDNDAYASLTDYIKANYGNFADYDVDHSQQQEANQEQADHANINVRSHFIKNSCDECYQYLTVAEDGRQDNHNMRVELWIPKKGLIINDIETQAFYFYGAGYQKTHIWSYYNQTSFYKTVAANNISDCYITFLASDSYETANCIS